MSVSPLLIPSYPDQPAQAARPCESRGFTLIELLVVIAVIVILLALIFPVISRVSASSQVAKSMSHLQQIGVAFRMYANENNNYIPGAAASNNLSSEWETAGNGWWNQDLSPYVGGAEKAVRGHGNVPDYFGEPIYRSMVGKQHAPGWRGGFSMNTRMGLAAGLNYGQYHKDVTNGIYSSREGRQNVLLFPADTVLVTLGYWEAFTPANDGTVSDARFSAPNTSLVPHNRRIGANSDGLGGRSAHYLLIDGRVLNLEPDEAKEFLRLRTP